jgi:hypothetical protein
MRADDGHFYVVKFQNNPQHQRVLANDFFASKLAEKVGLPVPWVEVVEVDGWLVEHTSELSFQLANHVVSCPAGLQFGSRYVIDLLHGQVLDYLPETMIGQVRNLETFAGILAPMEGRRRSGGSGAKRSTPRRLSTRAIASTQASEAFQIRRCAGCSCAMMCMSA